ncbi:MAG: transglutaminase domain-containing protein [Patescibacteria group bacterium]|nr:transglutaminase domain-containing protein [Candidatus Beckwithbacteria bacterium]MDZ4228908.1 transglutaminase domain-containing protein [Patescibacteria group bacterium]
MVKKLILALVLVFVTATRALAQGEFTTNYQVDYQVATNGQTRAQLQVELINKLSNIYASEFALSIGSTNLTNIRLTTPEAELTPQVVQGNKTTNITVVFPEKVLGKDKSQQFTLEFTTTDFARSLGNVWEISIPKLAESESLSRYDLTLSIPASFGQAAVITPAPISQTKSGPNVVFRFNTESLFENGISATFGQEQWYDFNLKYQLNNPNFYPVETEIALPPDTPWQQVLYQTIEPAPSNIRVDPDGNWLASYRLGSQANLEVVATGSATLFLKPRSDFPRSYNDTVNYLKFQPYWESDQPKIKALAKELTTPKQIYLYVVSNLIYDYGRLGESITRLGAANALDNRDSALCMEFTDLFIALSRAAGIPARAVNGYAYTDNSALRPLSLKQDVLHAWPEYYDPEQQLWRPVDPTWGNTTGGVDYFSNTDLNHFAFVILGQDSRYPIPAGAYKTDDQPAKNVHVDFGRSVQATKGLKLSLDLPKESLAGVNLKGKIIVANTGNVALYRVPVQLTSQLLKPQPDSWQIEALPPLSRAEIEFTLPASGWNSRFTDTLTAASDLDQTSRQLTVTPAYNLVFGSLAFRLALASLLGLVMLKLIYARLVKSKSHQ